MMIIIILIGNDKVIQRFYFVDQIAVIPQQSPPLKIILKVISISLLSSFYLQRIDGNCLLGQHLVYERRKSGDCCFNGEEYEREINITTCACEEDDFEWWVTIAAQFFWLQVEN